MNKTIYPSIKETLYHDTCQNGLNVYILKKEGFSKTYATISAQIGGINTSVIKNGTIIDLPAGIAHFLEHKLFEINGKDVSLQFASMQAKVNAFTQSNKTAYLFTATDQVIDNTLLLLDFVLHPEFTEDGIEKEKDIITQEINMYLDNPNAKIYNQMMNQLYVNHPANLEVLGDVESITKLNKELLEIAHEAFYNPKDMILFIAGNVDVIETMTAIKEAMNTPIKESGYETSKIENDYNIITIKDAEITADIITPQALLGVKLPVYDESIIVKKDITLGLLLDVLFGKTTDIYQELLSKELINETFSKEATLEESHSYLMVGGDSNNPKELLNVLKNHLLNATKIEITEERFEEMKRRFIGSFIQAFNYVEFISNNFSKYHYQGHSLFELLDLYKEITIDDIYEMAKELEKEEYYTSTIMNPIKKGA